jgi:hypothetical protein
MHETLRQRIGVQYHLEGAPTAPTLPVHVVLFRRRSGGPARLPLRARRVEQEHVTKALAGLGQQAHNDQLRDQVMDPIDCSRRTAQLAIADFCRQGSIVQADGQYRLRSDSCDFAPGRAGANRPAGSRGLRLATDL